MLDVNDFDQLRIGLATADDDADLDSDEDLDDEGFSADGDPTLDSDIGPEDAEGVLEEDEA